MDVVDIATLVTYQRYTGNWRGAFASCVSTTHKMSMMMGKGMEKTLPGLDNFYMIGQWSRAGCDQGYLPCAVRNFLSVQSRVLRGK
jgi:hypothetical protein